MISISSERSLASDNKSKTCISKNCNNIAKSGLNYCKNHKPKRKKCQFKGCGNNTKPDSKYCGVHTSTKSKQTTSQIRKLRNGTYQVQSSVKDRHSSSSQSQSYHKCRHCNTMIGLSKQLCKSCKRISNLPIEKVTKSIEIGTLSAIHEKQTRLHKHKMDAKRLERRIAERQKSSSTSSQKAVTTSTEDLTNGILVCEICGKDNTSGRIAKGVGKTVGNSTMGVFGTLTFLTGGLTAPLMLGATMIGAAISGSAEKYSICAECRAK